MDHRRIVRFVVGLILLYLAVVSSDVVRVRRGRPVVLQCEADPGDTLLSVTWKLHLYNSSCVISYRINDDNKKTSHSSCSTRMRSDRLSMSISHAEVSDEGKYSCEVVNDKGTFIRDTLLQVLNVVQVRRGQSVVLQCEADHGNSILSVVWRLHLYNSSCSIFYILKGNKSNITSHSSCSAGIGSDLLSLSIGSTKISDEGKYSCKIVSDKGTFTRDTILQVLAQPSIRLKLNSDGSPECGAVGGNPPAEISWIPHSNNISMTILEEPDQTRTVVSTLRTESLNETAVTCVVSHPTFLNPWTGVLSLSGYNFRLDNILRLIITVIFTILLAGRLLYLKFKRQEENIPREQIIEK